MELNMELSKLAFAAQQKKLRQDQFELLINRQMIGQRVDCPSCRRDVEPDLYFAGKYEFKIQCPKCGALLGGVARQ